MTAKLGLADRMNKDNLFISGLESSLVPFERFEVSLDVACGTKSL